MANVPSLKYVGPYLDSLGVVRYLPNTNGRVRRNLPTPFYVAPDDFITVTEGRPTMGQIWPRGYGDSGSSEVPSTGVHAYRASNQAVSAGVATVITLSGILIDDNNYWSIANPTRLTAPSEGWYIVNGEVDIIGGGADYINLTLRLNGISTDRAEHDIFIAGPTVKGQVTSLFYLAAGEYVEMYVFPETVGVTLQGGSNNIFLQMARL